MRPDLPVSVESRDNVPLAKSKLAGPLLKQTRPFFEADVDATQRDGGEARGWTETGPAQMNES